MLQSLQLPPLSPGVIQLWYASAHEVCEAAAAEELYELLSADERQRAGRFYFESNRREYLVGRAMVRLLVAKHLGAAPSALRFRTGLYGKPELAWPRDAWQIAFNVSHSSGAVVAAVGVDMDLGVDVEDTSRSVSPAVIEQAFTAEEIAQFASAPTARRSAEIMSQWTLKEAYLKARGAGLNLPLLGISFAPGTSGRPLVRFSSAIQDDPARWTFVQAKFGGRYIASVAASLPDIVIELHDLGRMFQAANHHDCHPEHCVPVAG